MSPHHRAKNVAFSSPLIKYRTETIYDSDAEDEESLADEAFAQPLVGGGGPSAQEISGQEDIYDDFEEEQGEIEYTGNSM